MRDAGECPRWSGGSVVERVVYPLSLAGSYGAGGFTLDATQGVASVTYLLQVSTNLAPPNWETIATNVPATNGPLQFADPLATNAPMRFYRTVTPEVY